MLSIGVDIGGTFTDVIAFDGDTMQLREAKTLSTPDDPTIAIREGLAKLRIELGGAERFVHGTTRVTNSLLEGSGDEVGLVTTAGFRDVIEMGRGHRPRLYSVKEPGQEPLVPRELRLEVRERVRADGTVETSLEMADVDAAAARLAGSGVTTVAVCLLHSYRNAEHEQAVARRLQETLPGLACSVSSEVVAEPGEYERFATTVLNAKVSGSVRTYLAGLADRLREQGYAGRLSIMTSSGGIVSAEHASRMPMHLALSGPAGGVAASAYVAGLAGYDDVITCDIGGTSTDVCLIRGGLPLMTSMGEIAGFPNKTFQIEINTIGAGGGSVASRDLGGELRIGPRSMGSTPGPACYGRGGGEPTLTDAHLLVGHLDAAESLGGEVRLAVEPAQEAMSKLAAELGGMDATELARGVLALATLKMTSAIKEISVGRGHDPRDFTLVPFGGAGPMHATALADELGIRRVLVPPVPGTFSALGFVAARTRHDYVATLITDVDPAGTARAAAVFAELERTASEKANNDDGLAADELTFEYGIGMRFRGQSHDLVVKVTGRPEDADALRAAFLDAYRRRFSYTRSDHPIEIVNVRLTALGPVPRLALVPEAADGVPAPTRTEIFTQDGWQPADVWRRDCLAVGFEFSGPAVVREIGCTTVVGAGWNGTVDDNGCLVLSRA